MIYKDMLQKLREDVNQPVEAIAPAPRKGLVNKQAQEAPAETAPTDSMSMMKEWASVIKASGEASRKKLAEGLAKQSSMSSPRKQVEQAIEDIPTGNGLVKKRSSLFNSYDGGDENFSLDASDAASVLRHFEGFRNQPYWDVNAYRTGYGTDTITQPDGSVVPVTAGSFVTKEDAERDLKRRIGEFTGGIVNKVGIDSWASLPTNAQSALVSVAYNYGSLPNSVVSAVRTGDLNTIANAVSSLKSNPKRRRIEASLIKSGV